MTARREPDVVREGSLPNRFVIDFPRPVLCNVLKFLVPSDILQLKLTCRSFQRLLTTRSTYSLLLYSRIEKFHIDPGDSPKVLYFQLFSLKKRTEFREFDTLQLPQVWRWLQCGDCFEDCFRNVFVQTCSFAFLPTGWHFKIRVKFRDKQGWPPAKVSVLKSPEGGKSCILPWDREDDQDFLLPFEWRQCRDNPVEVVVDSPVDSAVDWVEFIPTNSCMQ
eukprot:Gregarina_sp_Poly_1__3662@NODE_207_length_11414_cov_43_030493_g184_i0_p7_GENE_NODE_207_length_11414_cov_43_030493_g184_i0NODE_207_length_11414_cov_43_030493_g184_i0_p7_ORF_typecomplete_len220_score26_76Fbox/PF00646_33/3_5e06Fboxlike/PF12937_7/0_0014Fboxlike/PF12937_7/8_6e03_NODE_207_length_11414_cov_43_030493_g184_i020452704